MPILIYKNKKYFVRWPKKYNKIIRDIGKEYRMKGGHIDWQGARIDGRLEGLEKFTNRQLSQRHYSLLPGVRYRRKLKRRQNPQLSTTTTRSHWLKNYLIFKQIPKEDKIKLGWRPRNKWTSEQNKLLLSIVKKHSHGDFHRIRWQDVLKEKKIILFPSPITIDALRKHYWSIISRSTPKAIKLRRKAALRYKYDNIDRYHSNQDRRRKIVTTAIREFLFTNGQVK